jgi:hypothetical protein
MERGRLPEIEVIGGAKAALEDDRRVRPIAGIRAQADIIRVHRLPPLPTAMGRFLLFHLIRLQREERSAT